MNELGLMGLLVTQAAAIVILSLAPGHRLRALLNIAASFISFIAACSLFFARPENSDFFLIDDFNIYLVVLNTFIGFTTSVFSASYIGHELETGNLTPAYLRFYHAMYQAMLGAMNLALV